MKITETYSNFRLSTEEIQKDNSKYQFATIQYILTISRFLRKDLITTKDRTIFKSIHGTIWCFSDTGAICEDEIGLMYRAALARQEVRKNFEKQMSDSPPIKEILEGMSDDELIKSFHTFCYLYKFEATDSQIKFAFAAGINAKSDWIAEKLK